MPKFIKLQHLFFIRNSETGLSSATHTAHDSWRTYPIKAALLLKGYVTRTLSTLSTPNRKEMIRDYQKRQLNQMDMDVNEIATLVNGRKANEAYRKQALRMRNERDEMAKKLELSTMAVLDIINAVDLTTPIKVESLLSPFLIRELRKANK